MCCEFSKGVVFNVNLEAVDWGWAGERVLGVGVRV